VLFFFEIGELWYRFSNSTKVELESLLREKGIARADEESSQQELAKDLLIACGYQPKIKQVK
jgi:hypothetical protein